MPEVSCVTLMCIQKEDIIEKPDGNIIVPTPHRLVNVMLDNVWLKQALAAQRNCEDQGEPFIIRLFDDDDPTIPPVFAVAILTVPAFFSAFVTNERLGN